MCTSLAQWTALRLIRHHRRMSKQDSVAPPIKARETPVVMKDVANPAVITLDQEKLLSDYATRAGKTVEQARAEWLAMPNGTTMEAFVAPTMPAAPVVDQKTT
jgi:hypothetical protein